MRSVCFKEKLDITSETLTDIITSANNDVRLVLNHLSMLAADKSNLEASTKYIKLVRYTKFLIKSISLKEMFYIYYQYKEIDYYFSCQM